MDRPLGVGIIGVSPTRGWARISHVPAVHAIDGLSLAGVISSDRAKAEASAKQYGAGRGYATAAEMYGDPQIDIVSVCVKVPDHMDLVLGALSARKHVYCEWPLAPTVDECRKLAHAAGEAGVHVAIGLQSRLNPSVGRASTLLAEGAIGRVLSARVYSTTAAWGSLVEPAMVFAEDPASAVNLVTIQAMHTIDLATSLVGGLSSVNAIASRQFPDITVEGEPGTRPRKIFDHLLAQALLLSGAVLNVEVAGGRPADQTPFIFEITGETGTLVLEGGALRGFQAGRLALKLNGSSVVIDEGEAAGLPAEAVNVAGLYAKMRDDILNHTQTVPDFDHAVKLSRLIDQVLESSQERRRVQVKSDSVV